MHAETKTNLIEPLLERIEKFSTLSILMLKLKSIQKSTGIASSMLAKLIALIVLILFIVMASTAFALWIGDMTGKNYYGFSLVAVLFGLLGIVLLTIQPQLKKRIQNSILSDMINETN